MMTNQNTPEQAEDSDALPTLWVREDEARSPVRVTLTLDENELAALADRHDLPAAGAFTLKATVSRMKGGRLRVEGSYAARWTYLCGVTLQPFDAETEESFDQIFVDPQRQKSDGVTIEVDPLSEDDPDVLINGAADVADLAYQLFALELDPYPRHPDASQSLLETEQDSDRKPEAHNDETQPSPFAALKDLKLN